jgi:hypothetical protein
MVEIGLQQFFGIVQIFVVLYHKLRVLDQNIGKHFGVILEDDKDIVKDLLSVVPLFVPNFQLDPPVVDLEDGGQFGKFFVHSASDCGVFAFFKVTPVEVEAEVELEEEEFVVAEDAQHLGILIGLIFHIMEHLVPKLHIVRLSHKTPFVKVRYILNDAVLTLEFHQFTPDGLFVFDGFTAVEVVSSYFSL